MKPKRTVKVCQSHTLLWHKFPNTVQCKTLSIHNFSRFYQPWLLLLYRKLIEEEKHVGFSNMNSSSVFMVNHQINASLWSENHKTSIKSFATQFFCHTPKITVNTKLQSDLQCHSLHASHNMKFPVNTHQSMLGFCNQFLYRIVKFLDSR